MGKITAETIRTLLVYNADTGHLYWRNTFSARSQKGKLAGYKRLDGRWYIGIDKRQYLAHRLVWLYFNDVWPSKYIDHINGNPLDNRIENLRDISHRRNHNNRNAHRAGKLVGAYFEKRSKIHPWHSRIYINGKHVVLGYFSTEMEAHNAYLKALENLNE